jgi:hypothetical protein
LFDRNALVRRQLIARQNHIHIGARGHIGVRGLAMPVIGEEIRKICLENDDFVTYNLINKKGILNDFCCPAPDLVYIHNRVGNSVSLAR